MFPGTTNWGKELKQVRQYQSVWALYVLCDRQSLPGHVASPSGACPQHHALQAAARSGHVEIVGFLLAHGADVNAQGDKAEEKASDHLWIEERHFKKHGNALQAAAGHGHYQIVQTLIDNGADVNAKNEDFGTVMEVAEKYGDEKIIALLRRHGAV